MNSLPFTPALKRKFSPDAWPWVLNSLWQDELLWGCLEKTDLGSRALIELSGEPEKWTPASLALLDLRLPLKVEEIRSLPTSSIDTKTLHLARHTSRTWETIRAKPELRLGQVGLLALAMLESGESTSWRQVWADGEAAGWLTTEPGSLAPASTLVACLYDLVPEPLEMLRALAGLNKGKRLGAALCVHAVLSQPLPPAQQVDTFSRLLEGMGSTAVLTTLQILAAQRYELAQQVAGNLPANLTSGEGLGLADNEDVGRISQLMHGAGLEALRGEHKQAIPDLEEALQVTRKLQARLLAVIGETARLANDPAASLAAWKQAAQIEDQSPYLASELALAINRAGQGAKAKNYLAAREVDMPGDARIKLVAALVARQAGDLEKAIQAGTGALNGLTDLAEDSLEFEVGTRLDRISDLAKMFLDLGRPAEAAKAARLALQHSRLAECPLDVFVRSQVALGEAEPALAPAHLLAAIHPDKAAFQQLLVETLEEAGAWEAALEERQNAISSRPAWQPVSSREWRGLAHAAIRSGKLDQTISAAREALKLNAEDDVSYSLLGEAYRLLGDLPAARDHFWHATQIACHEPGHWLSLSAVQDQLEQADKVVETLRAASQAAPQAPQVHLALGEALLKEKSPSQALPALRRAADLLAEDDPRDQPVPKQRIQEKNDLARRSALGLGQALYQLGHFNEAEEVLSNAYTRTDENDTEVAYTYARVLLSLGDVRHALEPLERVVRSEPSDADLYLLYGRALLQSAARPVEEARLAVPALRKAIDLEGSSFDLETHSLLAEALMGAGDLVEAQEAFRLAMSHAQGEEPSRRARLSAGFGKVSLKLGQFDTAIATLQEAIQENPQSASIQRDLAEAYLAQGLGEEAIAAARTALRLDPSGVETLVWFAENANQFQVAKAERKVIEAEALEAWERAVQLAPGRGDLLVRLAEANLTAGNRQVATDALETITRSVRDEAGQAPPSLQLNTRDLHRAARLQLDLSDRQAAILLLEAAAQRIQPSSALAPEEQAHLLGDLSAAQAETGLRQEAMGTIEKALELAPDMIQLKLQKADLLAALGQEKEALDYLGFHLKAAESRTSSFLGGKDSSGELEVLHLKAASLLRQLGELKDAQAHAEEAAALSKANPEKSLYAAASLARTRFQPQRSRELVQGFQSDLPFHLACLSAELAFESGDEDLAKQYIAASQSLDGKHPRCLALQARLSWRSGNAEEAGQALGAAAQSLQIQNATGLGQEKTLPESTLLDTWLAFGEAAIEQQRWDWGVKAFDLAAQAAPLDPYAQRQLSRALVLRAEAERFCDAVESTVHAPGPDAISQDAYTAFHARIKGLAACRGLAGELAGDDRSASSQSRIQKELARWQARGEAAFCPSVETARTLAGIADGAEDTAALMANLRLTGDIRTALKAAQNFPAHPSVIRQMALAVGENSPAQAFSALKPLVAPNAPAVSTPHERAFNLALAAHLALRAHDLASAGQAILAALAIYPDEPRWHALAARVFWKVDGDAAAKWGDALNHLKTAVRLEPDYAQHYLSLGQAQQASGDLKSALDTLEQATNLSPDQAEVWIALARAQVAGGNLQAAAASAEKAVETAQDPADALLLRGEIALLANNPRGAVSRAQSILRTQPNHTAALQMLAEAFEQMERLEEALEVLNQVVPLLDQPFELELKQAHLLRLVRGKSEALQALQGMNARYPENPAVLAIYAEALLENGQTQTAVQIARQALQYGPDEIGRDLRGRLHFLIGRQLRKEGQLDQAIFQLSEGIQQVPDQLEAYLELGLAHQARRQQHQALNVFQKAIQIAPEDPRAYYQAGLALKESKDYLSAESMLRKAAALAPDDVSIHRLLGAVVALNLVHNRRPDFGSES